MKIILTKSGPEDVQNLRKEYLNELCLPQELYLEMKVRESEVFLLQADGKKSGYCCIGKEHDVTELYLKPEFLPFSAEIFDQVLADLRIEKIWCKTFDRLLLSLCCDKGFPFSVEGMLFREYIPQKKSGGISTLKVRVANESDLDLIWSKNDGFFETREELDMVFREEILLYFQKGGEFVGCGTIMYIHRDSIVYDIGMMVSPEHRMKGIGSRIVEYLVDYCKEKGWKPNAGCAAENIASRKTLEKVGFRTQDRLLLFTVWT